MTKYERLAQSLEQDIMQQIYKQGERLPSIGTMAKKQGCSKETVIKAYQLLIHQHLIYAKAQSGYYALGSPILPISNTKEFSLETGNPAIKATSLEDAKHCLSLAIEEYRESSLNLSLQGVQSLRQTLADFFFDMGIYTQESSIYLIQGVTQMLSFLSAIDFPNQHTYILIEEPTYSYYVQFLKSQSLPVLTIARDENGIDLTQLQYLFQHYDIKFFYTIPRNHNPLGTTYSTSMRQKIAQLALKYNVYIIEDDYDSEFRMRGKPLSPLFQIDQNEHVIYMNTFSKTLAPSFRISYMILPPHLVQIFQQKLGFYTCSVSSFEQIILAEFIQNHHFEKHINRMRNYYKSIRDEFLLQLSQSPLYKQITITEENSGLHFLLHFSLPYSDNFILKRAQDLGINMSMLSQFYDQPFDSHTIVINYSGLSIEDIPLAVQLLCQLLME